MKKFIVGAWVLWIGLATSAIAAEGLKPLKELPVEEGESCYLVEDGEATINDQLIKRIAIGKDKVTASYRNKGTEAKRPNYTVRLYNAYGFLMGEEKVRSTISFFGGGVGYLEPKEIGSEDLYVEWLPLDRMLRKSPIKLSDDWQVVKWVVISDSNTVLKKEADLEKKEGGTKAIDNKKANIAKKPSKNKKEE